MSLDVDSGDAVVVRGASGAGKTTLMNVIAGYCGIDNGVVLRPQRIGYLFQEELLFTELSVLDLMRVRVGGAAPKDTDGLARGAAGIEECRSALRQVGLLELCEQRVALLSGGERRRVELASMLACDPELVLLDEPAFGLDLDTCELMYRAIWTVFARRAVVLVSHDRTVPGLPQGAREVQLEKGTVRERTAR